MATGVVALNCLAWAVTTWWVRAVQDSQSLTGAFPDPPTWWRSVHLATALYWNLNLVLGLACVACGAIAAGFGLRLKAYRLGLWLSLSCVASGGLLVVLSVVGTF